MADADGPRSDPELTERAPAQRARPSLVALCGLVVLLDGADNIAIGLVGHSMAQTTHAPAAALGPVFSAGQFGFLFGSLLFGPLADRAGRKPVLIGAAALFGAATLATTLGSTVTMLVVLRFVTGLGMGGAAPVAIALAAEFAPARMRATVVALVWGAFPFGGVVIGLASVPVLPRGWQPLFWLIGAATLVVAATLLAALPESPGFLAARDRADGARQRRVPLRELFVGSRALRTPLLWGAFFGSFLPLVFVVNWAPTVLLQHGISPSRVGLAITLHSLGSTIGSGGVGRLMDRLSGYPVTLGMLGVGALTLVGFGVATSSFALVAVAIALCGLFTGAGQSGTIALGSLFYPTVIRSTGVGWAMAIGRLGSATGPLIGAGMIAAAWSPLGIFGTVALFPFAAALLLVLVRAVPGRQARPTGGTNDHG